MHLKNKAARLITFSWNKEKYRLLPAGDSVPVPDEAKKSAFLKSLIEDGSVEIVSASDAELDNIEDTESDDKTDSEAELDELRDQASDLGIDIDKRWGSTRLKEEIEKALEE